MLRTLNITVTESCNLNCKHCGADGNCSSVSNGTGMEELSVKEYYKVLEEAKSLGCKHVIIAGGEPFLREGIWDILQFIEKMNMTAAILTNGTLIDEKAADNLSKYKNISYVRISLDYNDETKMESFRGVDGLVKKVFNSIENLHRHNIKTAIGMTIMPDNIQDIIPIATRAKDAGVSFFRAIPMMPIGRAKNTAIDTGFYADALAEMIKLAQIQQDYYLGTMFLPKDLADVAPELVSKCPGGESSISLSAYGHVTRCPLTAIDMEKPTVREVGLARLYSMEIEKKNLEKEAILNSRNSSCSTCNQRKTCYGGCLAEINARFDTLDISQPICIQEVWKLAIIKLENTPLLKRTVNNILVLNETIKSGGTDFCLRSLPVWWISYPKNKEQLEEV